MNVDDESVIEPAQEIVLRELKTLRIFLERPSVQQQLVLLAAILIGSWLLAYLTEHLLIRIAGRTPVAEAEGESTFWHRLLPAMSELLFPIYAMISLQVAVYLMAGYRQTSGLLLGSTAFLWLLFIARLVGALLQLKFDADTAKRYQRRIVAPLALWILVVLAVNILNLESIGDIVLFTIQGTTVTLGRLLSAVTVIYFILVASSLIQDILRLFVLPRTEADPGIINSILATTRYLMILLAVLAALAIIGFSLTTIAVIGGGLSIGVGIGLQQVVSNFIAGILLLFEQTLRPGDIIEVDGEIGVVEKLSIRSTLLRTNDNVELIIPNETFLSSFVKTYTKSNRHVRIAIGVGVSYDSDAQLVRRLLMDVALQSEDVRKHPGPVVFFTDFGDSSLNFVLNVWVDEPINKAAISSALRFAIWESFAEHDIEIPFPQRDLHLRTGWESLSDNASGQSVAQTTNPG